MLFMLVWLCRFVTIDSCISCAFVFSRQLCVVRLVRIALECVIPFHPMAGLDLRNANFLALYHDTDQVIISDALNAPTAAQCLIFAGINTNGCMTVVGI